MPEHPDPERRARIEALFEAALEQPAELRRDWLETTCEDAELLKDVRELLAAHDLGEKLLPLPSAPSAAARAVGRYRLVRELGRGGMGVVHLAERDDGVFRRRVAIKLLRAGPGDDELIGRLVAERQILASLDHPNIAQLLDGGVAEGGRPYLVMEYIDGVPLSQYCRERGLELNERLRLFCTVARAIHYAHGRLVVHRDLKPSNVLVTPDGTVKLLDFGIAKILDPGAVDLAHPAPQTRTGLLLMTPAYASPEQFRGEPATTVNDVWSLGVILYELLVGRRPFPLEGLSLPEAARVISEMDPAPPSTVVAEPRDRRRLRGDLDRIALAALRKEPDRRYGSAEGLADDIERFLSGQPIALRADSALYRAGKLVRRHRVAAAAAVLAVLLPVAYALTATVQERRVRLVLAEVTVEAQRAERINQVLLSLFEPGRPAAGTEDSAAGAVLRARLAEMAQGVRHPKERAEMLRVLGVVHHRLGDFARAAGLLEEAVALRRQQGGRHLALSGLLAELGDTYRMQERYAEAERMLKEALGLERELLGRDHPRIARHVNDLALVLRDAGDYAAAEPLAREALAMRRRLLDEDDPAVAASLNDLAALLRRRGVYVEALPLYQEALAIRRRAYPGDHWLVAETINNVGVQLRALGDLVTAEPLLREAAAMYRRIYGAGHPYTAVADANLAFLLTNKGELDEAERLLLAALPVQRRVYGDTHHQVTYLLHRLGNVALHRGELDRAESLFTDALRHAIEGVGAGHPDVARGHHALGVLHRLRGRVDSAEWHLTRAQAIRLAKLGQHMELAETLEELGAVALDRGDLVAAERLLLQAHAVRRKVLPPDAPVLRASAERLATLYETTGREAEGRRFREAALEH